MKKRTKIILIITIIAVVIATVVTVLVLKNTMGANKAEEEVNEYGNVEKANDNADFNFEYSSKANDFSDIYSILSCSSMDFKRIP